MDEPPKKRSKFQLPSRPALAKKVPTPFPKAYDGVRYTAERAKKAILPGRMPRELKDYLGDCDIAFGIDIETHGWTETPTTRAIGPFGFCTLSDSELASSHIVQIGWAVHDASGFLDIQERTVKLQGVRISQKAFKVHGITNEDMEAKGIPLADALQEFMCAAEKYCKQGARVISHHMEFDAGIIAYELARAGLSTTLPLWSEMVKRGVCTMKPELGMWVTEELELEQGDRPKSSMLSLKDLARALVPREQWLLTKLHSAACDAHLHVLVYRALVRSK
jgi:DNA polymerase III epsilon subunit-like protein